MFSWFKKKPPVPPYYSICIDGNGYYNVKYIFPDDEDWGYMITALHFKLTKYKTLQEAQAAIEQYKRQVEYADNASHLTPVKVVL